MIKKIITLKKFGIFDDFNAVQTLNEFGKFNLFYGWNGSGKTTLSKLFYGLQRDKNLPSAYSSCEFKITTDGLNLTNDGESSLENLKVFNEDFINDNIYWNNKVEKILLLSESKISERTDLDNKIVQRDLKIKNIETYKDTVKKLKDSIERELPIKAKEIKTSFQTISPTDKGYFNYNKAKLEDFLKRNKALIKAKSGKLNEEDLLSLIEKIKPNEKNIVDYNFKKIEFDSLIAVEKKFVDLLSKNLTNGIIQRLKDNSDISQWVEKGFEIHEKHNNEKCEFCGNQIDLQHLVKLKKHFSDELRDLRDKVEKSKHWIEENLIIPEIKLEKELFYNDLQTGFLDAKACLSKEIEVLNSFFVNWKIELEKKFKNPSKEIELKSKIADDFLNNYESAKSALKNLINLQNERWKNFDAEYKQNQEKLELHYSTEFEENFEYFKKLDDVLELENSSIALVKDKNTLVSEILALNSNLSSEVLGAEEFNKNLAKFIGHKEIELVFNADLQGYDIIRKHINKRAENLSEGEKTAIAFVYFVTKLREKVSLKNEIVVIDDPISSFDSNNLFSAYSFIKTNLEQVKQLIILTHNFTFFRLVRDWIVKKNKDGKILSIFFQIEVLPDTPRKSIITNIAQTLLDYSSEYHFVFSKLYNFKDYTALDLEKSFQVANLSRKLLESFLSFKYPKKRNDFRVLLQVAVLDSHREEKIYRFINKYSHLPMDYNDTDENNLMGESDNIIKEVFSIVEKLDKVHFDEMILISKS